MTAKKKRKQYDYWAINMAFVVRKLGRGYHHRMEPYFHMGATIIEAVFNCRGVHTFQNDIADNPPSYLPERPSDDMLLRFPDKATVSGFCSLIDEHPIEELTRSDDSRKNSMVISLASFLKLNALEDEFTLARWINGFGLLPEDRAAYYRKLRTELSIPEETARYLAYISGADDLVIYDSELRIPNITLTPRSALRAAVRRIISDAAEISGMELRDFQRLLFMAMTSWAVYDEEWFKYSGGWNEYIEQFQDDNG